MILAWSAGSSTQLRCRSPFWGLLLFKIILLLMWSKWTIFIFYRDITLLKSFFFFKFNMSASLNYLIWIILRVQLLILDRVAICKWVFEYPKSPIPSGVGMEPFLDSRDFESGFGSMLIGFWTFRSRTRSIYVPTRTGQLHSLIKITYIGLKGLIIKKKKKKVWRAYIVTYKEST